MRLSHLLLFLSLLATGVHAQSRFFLPTPNQAIFESGAEEAFFAKTTPTKEWSSGAFGCVRNSGWRFHEGIDILHTQTDARGEPIDPIFATTDGIVAYINTRTGTSNYGKYIVLEHRVDGLRIYSLYAHLSAIDSTLSVGSAVHGGQRIATMGRTAPISPPIAKFRAHLHFEIGLILNDHYADFLKAHSPNATNHHGNWNGLNLSGLDPRAFFQERRRLGSTFDLQRFIRDQDTLFQVVAPTTDFFFARQYPQLIVDNPSTRSSDVVAMEIAFNYHGLPFQLIPRSASEVGLLTEPKLVGLDQRLAASQKCCRLVETSRPELRSAAWTRIKQLLYQRAQDD